MTQFLRFLIFSILLFFGLNVFAQSNVIKLENSPSNLKHIKSNKLMIATPSNVVKQESNQTKYPEKPKKVRKNTQQGVLKPPKSQETIIHDKKNPK